MKKKLAILRDCAILFAVMRDKNIKTKTVKLRGPNGTTKEITAEEWAGYGHTAAFNYRIDKLIKAHKKLK